MAAIKVDMDPVGRCGCILDRARSPRTLNLSDLDNPHPCIAPRAYHRSHGSHDARTIYSWSTTCPCMGRPRQGDGGRTFPVLLHKWIKDDGVLFDHNTRPWAWDGKNKSAQVRAFHHIDDHDHDHDESDDPFLVTSSANPVAPRDGRLTDTEHQSRYNLEVPLASSHLMVNDTYPPSAETSAIKDLDSTLGILLGKIFNEPKKKP